MMTTEERYLSSEATLIGGPFDGATILCRVGDEVWEMPLFGGGNAVYHQDPTLTKGKITYRYGGIVEP